MYRLSRIRLTAITVILWALTLKAQNPHGDDLAISCTDCHTTDSWTLSVTTEMSFDHDEQTNFPLEGRHAEVECVDCHSDLTFKNASTECVDCHTDVHQQTVGNDCSRCHTAENWLVDNVPQIHEQNGFPLEGSHAMTSCIECHTSSNTMAWNRVGNECVDCHREEYFATTNPSHVANGFSLDCIECHEPISQNWEGGNSHFFFPLVQGHDALDCSECHQPNQPYTGLDPNCVSCHLDDYNSALEPNHALSGLSRDCAQCHDLTRGWPANLFDHDGEYFPIYSGTHQGEWNSCVECHTNTSNYSLFSCIDCHEHNDPNDLADEHDDVGGYQYVSTACLDCHPNGSE